MNPQLEELACLYALDQLSWSERADFEARLSHDTELADLVRELQGVVERRVRDLPRHEPPEDLLSRVEARIGRSEPRRAEGPALWSVVARWGIAAVIAVGVGILAVQSLRRAPAPAERSLVIVGLEPHQSTLAELPLLARPQGEDARFIQLASLAEQYWEKPQDLPFKMASNDKDGRGYALFDPGSNQGFIAVHHLPSVGSGKRYHLWVFDSSSGQVREAGVLPATDPESGLYFFSVSPITGAKPGRLGFFVTAEDSSAANVDQPHGKVVLGDRTF